MKLQYLGHSCFLLETAGKRLIFDPFISPNELASAIDVNAIECDYILVSHGHADHIADMASIGKRTGATVVSNFEIVQWAAQQGVENGHPMNNGGNWQFDFGRVQYTNAVHSSSFPDGSYAGQAGGFIIHNDEGCLYFAGDTALHYDMKLLPMRQKIDWALLPIGDNFTMGIDDAVTAADFIGCGNIVGMHYDTFPWIVIDKQKAKNTFSAAGKALHLLDIGQTLDLGAA